tara:strand:- start:487 stop:741 length:255 start_codon:yes stop_codon:yes gene_type:complete
MKKEEIKNLVDRAVIRKDPFNGVTKQWQADLYFNDGNVWYSWCSGYRSKKSLIESIKYVHEDILIARAPYKESYDHDYKGDVIH